MRLTYECGKCAADYEEPLPRECTRCGGKIEATMICEPGDEPRKILALTHPKEAALQAAVVKPKPVKERKPMKPKEIAAEPIAKKSSLAEMLAAAAASAEQLNSQMAEQLEIAAAAIARVIEVRRDGEALAAPAAAVSAAPSTDGRADRPATAKGRKSPGGRPSKHRDKILAAIGENPGGLTSSEIAAAVGIPGKPQNIAKALATMAERGDLDRSGRLWMLAGGTK